MWKLAGESTFTKDERETTAFQLVGDVSTLIVPLAWPVPKSLETALPWVTHTQVGLCWQELVAPCDDPHRAAHVEFPQTPEALGEVYWNTRTGAPFNPLPWADRPADRPESWRTLVRYWYQQQEWYGERDFVEAFKEALEVHTGLPLEQFAPSLHSWLETPDTGEVVSVSKPASTPTKKPTARRAGRRSTTSSPAA